ncbi:hypothetical protein SAMN04488026_100341 [Aliiruegeria lutimaris]|uniref:Uncharacterized protein n=2 Tax=Aliiruegeria lutimaris TaxID=571298 RepID=A0A1G8KND2_9RHOB|nr:hypothetical protein SAMN04488026_100341 [Aliiruegeria lutimaris]
MSLMVRLLSACMFVAFILGTVVQGAAGGTMPIDMPEVVHTHMGALDCADCDEHSPEGSSECGGLCFAAQLAALPVEWADPVTGNADAFGYADAAFRNRAEPPAQTPPRPRFLM